MNCLVLLTVKNLSEVTYPVIINNVTNENEAIKVALNKVKICDPENTDDKGSISKVVAIELYKDILVVEE